MCSSVLLYIVLKFFMNFITYLNIDIVDSSKASICDILKLRLFQLNVQSISNEINNLLLLLSNDHVSDQQAISLDCFFQIDMKATTRAKKFD